MPIMAKRKAKVGLIGRQPKRTMRGRRVKEDDLQQLDVAEVNDCRDSVQNAQDTPDSVQNAQDTPDVQNTQDTPDVQNTEDTPDVQNTQDTPDVQNAQDTPDVQNTQDTPDVQNTQGTPDVQNVLGDEYERNRESFRSALAAMDQDISNCITLSERISQIVSEMGNDNTLNTADVGINQRFLSC